MNRRPLLVAALVLSAGVLGQTGAATAEDASPAATPSAAAEASAPAASEPSAATAAEAGATAAAAANQAPVATDDAAGVVAGRTVTVRVLANDTDDGLGRPSGETPHLQIATFDDLGGRVTADPTGTTLTVTARPADAGTRLEVGYTATDGTLSSGPARLVVTVAAPPVVRTVGLTTAAQVVALRRYSLHGSVRPLAPGPATVVVQRLSGSSWVTWRTDRADAQGRYSVGFSSNRPQRYTFRAVATWANGKRATSSRLTRTVVAKPDVHVSGPLTRSAVRWSYRAGCPVGPSGLRRITINRFTYGRVVARGSLVVRAGAVPDLLRVFRGAFAARFPVRSMKPADAFYAGGRRTPTASDLAAMRADNTSAFNCRPVTGNPYRVSQHSYGNAIDINTVRNPYVVGSTVYPSFARTYLDRSNVRPGMILRSGVIATRMRENGWPWGARWSHPDYQHFSSNGG